MPAKPFAGLPSSDRPPRTRCLARRAAGRGHMAAQGHTGGSRYPRRSGDRRTPRVHPSSHRSNRAGPACSRRRSHNAKDRSFANRYVRTCARRNRPSTRARAAGDPPLDKAHTTRSRTSSARPVAAWVLHRSSTDRKPGRRSSVRERAHNRCASCTPVDRYSSRRRRPPRLPRQSRPRRRRLRGWSWRTHPTHTRRSAARARLCHVVPSGPYLANI